MPEEEILVECNTSRIIFAKSYFIAIILFILWFALHFNFINLFMIKNFKIYLLFLPLISSLLVIRAEIRIRNNKFIITNSRVIHRWGFFSTSERHIGLNHIAHYSKSQSFIGRLFGIGTISIESTAGVETQEIVIKGVKINRVKEILDKALAKT